MRFLLSAVRLGEVKHIHAGGHTSAISGLPANRLATVHTQSEECELAFVDTEEAMVQRFFVFACYTRANWAGWRLREATELATWFVDTQRLISGERS